MARQTIAAVAVTSKYPTAPVTHTFTACDASNKEQWANTGREIIVFFNSGSTNRVCTVTSVASALTGNRTGDCTFTLGAGAYKSVGPLAQEGWMQSDGNTYSEAAHAEVMVSVIRT